MRAPAGTDFGVHCPRWLSRFGDAARRADQYRVGRVLLAGDAAHIHPPIGGQGLNVGVQDAIDIRYDLGEGPDLLWRRLRAIDVTHGRLYDLLHRGRACCWTAPNG